MKPHWLIWIPRGLLIALGALMLLFSLDSFGGDASLGQQLLGFLMHNLPLLAVLLILWLTWKRPLWGGIVFLALAAFFTLFFHSYNNIITFILVTLTPLLAAIIFLIVHFLGDGNPRS